MATYSKTTEQRAIYMGVGVIIDKLAVGQSV
jgi:hypothetical protein